MMKKLRFKGKEYSLEEFGALERGKASMIMVELLSEQQEKNDQFVEMFRILQKLNKNFKDCEDEINELITNQKKEKQDDE